MVRIASSLERVAWRRFYQNASTYQQTAYSYDDAGNLLTINYPTSPDVTFTYNEVNRIATMTTAGLGTSTFAYTDAEQLKIEYGLWASDGVTNTYHATVPGLRTGLAVAQHFAGAMDFEGFLNEESFTTMIVAFELDLKSLAEDAQGVVVSVKGAVDDGSDQTFGIMVDGVCLRMLLPAMPLAA